MSILPCSINSCQRKSVSRGWCDMHYRRWKRHGSPVKVHTGNGQLGDSRPTAAPEEQCSIEGCTSRRKVRGWCPRHYKRWLRGCDPAEGQRRDDDAPCKVDGCEETVRISGFCYAHYSRLRRHGDPIAGRKSAQQAIDHEDGSRTCNTCGETKTIDHYHRGSLYVRGRSPKCQACCGLERKALYESNRKLYDDRATGYRHKRRALLMAAGFEHGLTRSKIRTWHGDNCAYCGIEMDFNVRGRGSAPRKASIDHRVPISRGGGHVTANVTLCCIRCNSSKGGRTEEEFLMVIGKSPNQIGTKEAPEQLTLFQIDTLLAA